MRIVVVTTEVVSCTTVVCVFSRCFYVFVTHSLSLFFVIVSDGVIKNSISSAVYFKDLLHLSALN